MAPKKIIEKTPHQRHQRYTAAQAAAVLAVTVESVLLADGKAKNANQKVSMVRVKKNLAVYKEAVPSNDTWAETVSEDSLDSDQSVYPEESEDSDVDAISSQVEDADSVVSDIIWADDVSSDSVLETDDSEDSDESEGLSTVAVIFDFDNSEAGDADDDEDDEFFRAISEAAQSVVRQIESLV